jgi:hypothetical protein
MFEQTPRIYNSASSTTINSPRCGVSLNEKPAIYLKSNNVFTFEKEETDQTEYRDDDLSMSHSPCEYNHNHVDSRIQNDEEETHMNSLSCSSSALESSSSEISKCDSTQSDASKNHSFIRIKRACPVNDEESENDSDGNDEYYWKRRKHFTSSSQNVTELFWTQRVD